MNKLATAALKLYLVIITIGSLFYFADGTSGVVTASITNALLRSSHVSAYDLEDCTLLTKKADTLGAQTKYETKEQHDKRVENAKKTDEAALKACDARNVRKINEDKRRAAKSLAYDIATMLIAGPIFLVHGMLLYRGWRKEAKDTGNA